MHSDDAVPGSVRQFGLPDWQPLVVTLGELAGWFMWMFEIELESGRRLHAYKHSGTRRYLYVDSSGRAYEERPIGHYGQRSLAIAIIRVFAGWQSCCPSDDDLAWLRKAVARARRVPLEM